MCKLKVDKITYLKTVEKRRPSKTTYDDSKKSLHCILKRLVTYVVKQKYLTFFKIKK